MSEYKYILSLYQKHQQYKGRLALVSFALIVGVSIFVWLDLIRINPFILYVFAMAVALYYAVRSRVESRNYDKLIKFLQEHDPETLKNKELVFFIDYQLRHYFDHESDELIKRLNDAEDWNDEKATADLQRIITEIKNYHDYLLDSQSLEQEMEISLSWYKASIEQRKQDLV